MPRPFQTVRPPPVAEQDGSSYPRLVALIRRLLAPDGCPWDREQTFGSLRRHLLEEAGEVAQAIDEESRAGLQEELGDLLMHVAFLSELGRTEGTFGPDDVVASIVEKLIRRHPHVFGAVDVNGTGQVLENWERIKADERKQAGKAGGMLGSLPSHLPGLTRAYRVGEKVARVGFDWPDAGGPRAKVAEELAELDAAMGVSDEPVGPRAERIEEELGDLLFSLVNLARHLQVDPEAALHKTVLKFARRFAEVERRVQQEHGGWPADEPLPIDLLEEYWQAAKVRP